MASLPALHTHPPHTASALTALQCPSASSLAMSADDSKPTATLGHPFSPPAPAAVLSGQKPRTTESCRSSQALESQVSFQVDRRICTIHDESRMYHTREMLSKGIEILLYLTGDIHNPGVIERQRRDGAAIAWQLQDPHAGE